MRINIWLVIFYIHVSFLTSELLEIQLTTFFSKKEVTVVIHMTTLSIPEKLKSATM